VDGRPVDYRFLEVNPAFERQSGLTGATGKRARELVPGLEQHWFDTYGRVALTGEPVRFENHAEPLDRWFEVYAFRVGAPEQRHVGLLFSDVTMRHRAEAALRAEEVRFRLMADAVPQIAWITDADGRAEFFNKQWSDYTGAAQQPSNAAETAALYVHPDDRDVTLARFEEARLSGGVFEVEHRIRSRTGEYRWFLVRAEPYRDPATGEVARWFGASVDIHDRKEAAARQGFLLALDERLRALADPGEIMLAAAEMLGSHLAVARAGYGELDDTGEVIRVERDWCNGLASLAGEARLLEGFGAAIASELRAGRTLRVEDSARDPRVTGEGVAATWARHSAPRHHRRAAREGGPVRRLSVPARAAAAGVDGRRRDARAQGGRAHLDHARTGPRRGSPTRKRGPPSAGGRSGRLRHLPARSGHRPSRLVVADLPHLWPAEDAPLSTEAVNAVIHPEDRDAGRSEDVGGGRARRNRSGRRAQESCARTEPSGMSRCGYASNTPCSVPTVHCA
jgi:PAS domain S-box-containing protein